MVRVHPETTESFRMEGSTGDAQPAVTGPKLRPESHPKSDAKLQPRFFTVPSRHAYPRARETDHAADR
jgi:hypothetical protein